MTDYLVLCEPDEETGEALYRCMEEVCQGMAVLFPDLAEHSLKEHDSVQHVITAIEVGFDLSYDDPDPKRQKIKCRACGDEVYRTEAQGHAKNKHKSDYVYVNLLV